jgi:hypothetical protein
MLRNFLNDQLPLQLGERKSVRPEERARNEARTREFTALEASRVAYLAFQRDNRPLPDGTVVPLKGGRKIGKESSLGIPIARDSQQPDVRRSVHEIIAERLVGKLVNVLHEGYRIEAIDDRLRCKFRKADDRRFGFTMPLPMVLFALDAALFLSTGIDPFVGMRDWRGLRFRSNSMEFEVIGSSDTKISCSRTVFDRYGKKAYAGDRESFKSAVVRGIVKHDLECI